MNKRSILFWQFIGFIFTALFGTLLHFIFEWTNESIISAPFSAVNESTWEHMKILFIPMFVFALIQGIYMKKEYGDYWCIKLKGILLGIFLIPVLFYTYNGVFGKSPDWVNISIFFISAAIAYITETSLFKNEEKSFAFSDKTSFVLICVIGIFFFIFTFYTPQIPLFADPATGLYGFQK